MRDDSEVLMLTGTLAYCADCGDRTLFVPVEDGCGSDGCEFCCTACDAAMFLLDVLRNTVSGRRSVA
jgi:hypothetical protein